MHASAALLDEVLALIPSEMAALDADDLETAETMADRRAELLREAWRQREGMNEAELRERLVRVQTAQKLLLPAVETLRQKYNHQNKTNRQQAKYFTTERHLHSASRKAFYCDTLS